MIRRSTFLWPAMLIAGCSHYSQEDGERLAGEVFTLQSQVKALQDQLSKSDASTSKHFETIDRELEEIGILARRNTADLGAEVDRIREDIARTRGLAERLEAVETKLNKVHDDFALFEEKGRSTEAQAQAAIERERILNNPDALFGHVVGLINAQKATEARSLLREFVQRAETDRRLKTYLSKVQFLIAETYYAEGNYQLAATEYNVVRKNFPTSKEVPDALFQLGMCFEKLNLPEDAKLFYEQLRKKYKSSDAAKRAKDRLSKL